MQVKTLLSESLFHSPYQGTFDFYNHELFGGDLPAMTVLVARHPRMRGFYCPAAWCGNDEEQIDELRLNPQVFTLPLRDALSILVHKMCHYWQFGHGTPNRATRHDREWAEIMREVGLEPRLAARAGVCLCGQPVGHAIVPGGPFDRAFAAMPRKLLLPWTAAAALSKVTSAHSTDERLAYATPEWAPHI